MIRLNAEQLLKEKGKSKYWLWKQLGMSYQNFDNMISNRTKSIKYEILDAMCVIFNCTPNDLLIYEDDKWGCRVSEK